MPGPVHLFLLILTIILQVQVAPLFSVKSATPDFLLILVLAITFQKGRLWGIGAAFSAGLIFDVFGTGIIGLSSLAKSVSTYIAGFFASERLERGFGAVSGLLMGVLLLHDSLYYLVLDIGTQMSFWSVFVKHVIPSSIYTFSFLIMLHLIRPRALWGSPTASTNLR